MTTTTSNAPATVSWRNTGAAAGLGVIGGLIVNSLIAWAFRGLFDVPSEFNPLTFPAYGTLTVIGAIVGAIGWHVIAVRSRRATRLLAILVPVVVLLSFIPDVLLLGNDSQPGTTTAGVIALMLMHVGTAAAAVLAYRRFIPPQS